MRNGIFMFIVLVVAGIAYAAAPSTAPSTQQSDGGSCCHMKMMAMGGGMGCMMGDMKPATQPTAASPDCHAAHHAQ